MAVQRTELLFLLSSTQKEVPGILMPSMSWGVQPALNKIWTLKSFFIAWCLTLRIRNSWLRALWCMPTLPSKLDFNRPFICKRRSSKSPPGFLFLRSLPNIFVLGYTCSLSNRLPTQKWKGSLVQLHTQQFAVHGVSESWIWLVECYVVAVWHYRWRKWSDSSSSIPTSISLRASGHLHLALRESSCKL